MRILGNSDLGKRTQQVVRDDPKFKDTLASEKDGILYLYVPTRLKSDPEWTESYTEWAKLTPLPSSEKDVSASLHTIKPSNDADTSLAILPKHLESGTSSKDGRTAVYRLSHLALSGRWQDLDIESSLEGCIRAIVNNQYHLFFV